MRQSRQRQAPQVIHDGKHSSISSEPDRSGLAWACAGRLGRVFFDEEGASPMVRRHWPISRAAHGDAAEPDPLATTVLRLHVLRPRSSHTEKEKGRSLPSAGRPELRNLPSKLRSRPGPTTLSKYRCIQRIARKADPRPAIDPAVPPKGGVSEK